MLLDEAAQTPELSLSPVTRLRVPSAQGAGRRQIFPETITSGPAEYLAFEAVVGVTRHQNLTW